jgi:hypothetical protein
VRLPPLLWFTGYLATITADEAKISGEQARELDGLAEVMQRLKEFEMGNRS